MAAPIELLHKAPLFSGLGPAELASVAALAQRKHYDKGDIVVQQSDPSGDLFLIVNGHLKVVSAGADGRDTALGIMGPGEVIGEVPLLDGGPRSATVIALEPCTPSAAKVRRSAWIPAPPDESLPAIVNARGTRGRGRTRAEPTSSAAGGTARRPRRDGPLIVRSP